MKWSKRLAEGTAIVSLLVLSLIPATASASSEDAAVAASDGGVVIVRHITPPKNPIYSKGYSYFLDLLHLAFTKAGQPYRLQPVEVPLVPDSRSMMFLKHHKYDVMWLHTDLQREQELRPIRIPVYKGIIGWRLLFVKSDRMRDFAQMDIDGLKSHSAGLGHDWPDVNIMTQNNFTVRTAVSWQAVKNLLIQDRVDYFPRAINEIWREQAEMNNADIDIDTHFALNYRTAYYLFVAKENEKLATIIERGLEKAIEDGSFNALFYSYFSNNILKAKIPQRKIIYLTNPDLPPKTPVWRDELWLTEQEARNLELSSQGPLAQ